MRVLRVTRKDGHAWTVPIEQDRINVGRDPDNELVLEDNAVSRHHCLIERQGPHILVKDRGTPNGTFVNNEFLSEPRELREGDRVYVGPFLLELVALAQEGHHAVRVASPMGPVLRQRTTNADDRYGQRLVQWAQHWDAGGRPRSELLKGRLLNEARGHLRSGPADPVVRAFVSASSRRRTAGRLGIGAGVLGLLGIIGGALWFIRPWDSRTEPEEVASAEPEDESSLEPVPLRRKKPVEPPVELTWVEHEVIPAESIEDIARRYGATVSNVARWNGLNPDAPTLEVGSTPPPPRLTRPSMGGAADGVARQKPRSFLLCRPCTRRGARWRVTFCACPNSMPSTENAGRKRGVLSSPAIDPWGLWSFKAPSGSCLPASLLPYSYF